MINQILILILVTLVPALELRASIPLGILSGEINIFNMTIQGFGLPILLVFLICILTNILLGVLVYAILTRFTNFFLRFKLFNKYYHYKIQKIQRKIKPKVDKYGLFGIVLFIGMPIPGSGSYIGALAAHVLGIDYKKFIIANLLGVIIAGVLVTILTITGIQIFSLIN